ncbi:MAG: FAD-dependent oxidoreductase [Aeromicrobium sp.]
MSSALHPRDLLDRQLGRVTMYRLVTIVLVVLAVVMVAHTAAGTFTDPFTVQAELITFVVLVVASVVSSRLIGLAFRVRPHTESAVITGLLLWFMFWPSTEVDDLAWLAGAALLANASKYVFAWRGRHVLNPAAAGAVLVIIAQDWAGRESPINATWWIAAERLLPFVAVGALLVLWRTRRLDVGLVFVAVAYGLCVWGMTEGFGAPLEDSLKTVAYSFPIVFMAGFMVSEPLTLPPRRVQQLVVAVVVAVCLSYGTFMSIFEQVPPSVGVVSLALPEVALLVGNLVAFAFARRRGLTFELEQTRQLSPETHELTFRSRRRVPFKPGQYVELTVPHAGMDSRGARRTFSISSPPDDDGRVAFALRVPEKSSSFKRALLALEPGDAVHGTGIGGDFVWPADPDVPLLLVAGGIGITPFLSQLRHEGARDAVLVYGASSPTEVPFTEELAGARVVLVCPERPAALPDGWSYVEAPFLSAEIIAETVPDLERRRAYVSGPPAMVNAVRAGLRKRCVSLKTDYFSGY